jgi:hypothetical protein
MSISQFPNATPDALLALYDTLELLFLNAEKDVKQNVIGITAAHVCVASEFILNSPQLRAHSDPAIIPKLQALLDSCR